MRTSHPPGHVGLGSLKSIVNIGHISQGAASAVDAGPDLLHNTSAIAAGAIRQHC